MALYIPLQSEKALNSAAPIQLNILFFIEPDAPRTGESLPIFSNGVGIFANKSNAPSLLHAAYRKAHTLAESDKFLLIFHQHLQLVVSLQTVL